MQRDKHMVTTSIAIALLLFATAAIASYLRQESLQPPATKTSAATPAAPKKNQEVASAQPAAAVTEGGALWHYGGSAATTRAAPRVPTPLFSLGGLPVGVWARVAPPYDVTANRSFAADPLW